MIKDLCVRETYKDKNGADVTNWNKIGTLIEANDKQYVKLFHMPGVLVSVFEKKKKEETESVEF